MIVGTVPDTFLDLADSGDTRQIYDLTALQNLGNEE